MPQLGIAGSGRYVCAFVSRLAAAGIATRVFTPTPGNPVTQAEAEGFMAGLKTLVLVPKDLIEAEALLFETPAFAKQARSLGLVAVAGTLSPRYVRALRGRIANEIALVDAPFSGTLTAAGQGRLTFFTGGRGEDLVRLDPVLQALGRRTIRMGCFGAAMAAKVMNDALAASSAAMMRLALDWAEAQGIDETRVLQLARDNFGGLLTPGQDPADDVLPPASDETLSNLTRDIEAALGQALTGAHLTPPRALADMLRAPKARPLH